jgi:WD40 repeat protein
VVAAGRPAPPALRLPVDVDDIDVGKAYAVAMSPDGNTVAVGGWTTSTARKDIILFDRASGQLIKRFADLPNVVHQLAYSSDGRRLVASLGGSNGIRVFDAGNGYQLLPSDTQYNAASYFAMFDLTGRLVTTSYDGFVRLYAADKYAAPIARFHSKGRTPFTAAFSPDGTRVAVGFNESEVVVLSGSNLTELFKPNLDGVPNVAMDTVGWSQDGRHLFAGGFWKVNNVRQVRRWSGGGRGAFIDIPAASQTIMEFRSLKDGSMLFAYARGFGLINLAAKVIELGGRSDLELTSGPLRVSMDGTAVQVDSWEPKHTYRFTLARRVVDIDPPHDDALKAPITNATGLDITNWQNLVTPAVNGKPIKLLPYESARSIARARHTALCAWR